MDYDFAFDEWDVYFKEAPSDDPVTVDIEDDWREPQPYTCDQCGAVLEDHWKPCEKCDGH